MEDEAEGSDPSMAHFSERAALTSKGRNEPMQAMRVMMESGFDRLLLLQSSQIVYIADSNKRSMLTLLLPGFLFIGTDRQIFRYIAAPLKFLDMSLVATLLQIVTL
ncbi:hypothetical protein Ancab_032190 [Ancistrocladus abbreviatus]